MRLFYKWKPGEAFPKFTIHAPKIKILDATGLILSLEPSPAAGVAFSPPDTDEGAGEGVATGLLGFSLQPMVSSHWGLVSGQSHIKAAPVPLHSKFFPVKQSSAGRPHLKKISQE